MALLFTVEVFVEGAKLEAIRGGVGVSMDLRQDSLKGCSLSSLNKCYGSLPPDGSTPSNLLEEIGQIADAQTCQSFCKDLYPGACTWFMFDRTTNDCKLFSGSLDDLRADCKEIGYAKEPAHASCDVVFDSGSENGCYNFREDYCRFEFSLLENLEDIETLSECQLACEYINNCSYFVYDRPTKICKLNTMASNRPVCDIIHGTPEPDFNTCVNDGQLDWASNETNTQSGQSTSNEPKEYDYRGEYHRKCKNADGNQPLTCKLNDQYRGTENTSPTDECKAACDQASSCIAIGTHYFCDRLFFSDYETALKEIPDDLCKNWEYTNTKDNSVYCDENGLCGAQENTNGCFVKQIKSD